MKYLAHIAAVSALSAVATLSLTQTVVHAAPESLKVMSYNLFQGGDGLKQPLSQSVAVVEAAKADVVGLQETSGYGDPRPDNSEKMAQSLGWNHLNQGASTSIISKHKIIEATPKKWGILLETPAGNRYWLFNAHLGYKPYQPYQLLNIPYQNAPFLKTEAEAIEAANAVRKAQVARMIGELEPALKSGFPVFLTGDFNEPSYQDWTEAAAKAGMHPLKVEWPSTKTLAGKGLTDSYRATYPDEVKRPGHTWTPTTKIDDPKDHHDRLDFIFYGGKGVKLTDSSVVGEAGPYSDIAVTPYPSDHRSVVSTFEIGS